MFNKFVINKKVSSVPSLTSGAPRWAKRRERVLFGATLPVALLEPFGSLIIRYKVERLERV